jgi:hypothetical protein
MGLRARALLYRYSRTASEDRATVLRCCLSARKMGLGPVCRYAALGMASWVWHPGYGILGTPALGRPRIRGADDTEHAIPISCLQTQKKSFASRTLAKLLGLSFSTL